jgi:hypothetical protein
LFHEGLSRIDDAAHNDIAAMWSGRGIAPREAKEVPVMTMQHDSTKASTPRLYSPREAAEFLGVSVDTLARWRVLGSGPAFVKFSPAKQAIVRYRREDLERFVGAHVHTSTSS